MRHFAFLLSLFAITISSQFAANFVNNAEAADWPLYRGPNQDGISQEAFSAEWGGDGPKVVWRGSVHNGFSSFAVSGGKVFTETLRDIGGTSREICVALDANTGKELWSANLAAGEGYDGGGGDGDGTRSTPTINDGKVYCFTSDLIVHCLDAATGKQIWKRDLVKQNHGKNIHWQNAASVPIEGDLALVAGGGPGESMLGLNKETGAVVWKAGDEHITHSTPVLATIDGQRQVIYFMQSGLVSVAPTTGKLLWKFPFPFHVSTAISPVVSGNIVYCSAGYDSGSAACRIEKTAAGFEAVKLWQLKGNQPVSNHWSTPVCKDGFLYGMFGFKEFNKKGRMKCVELATGKVRWEQYGFGQGNVILVGGRLLALNDQGELIVVEAKPDAYHEVARTKAVQGKCWSTPAFADGKVYIRSVSNSVCLDLSK